MTEIEILMHDGCTLSEAQKHLERGTLIIDDLEEHFNDYMLEWGMGEEEQQEYKTMIEAKKPLQDWGIVEVDGKRHYIQYVL